MRASITTELWFLHAIIFESNSVGKSHSSWKCLLCSNKKTVVTRNWSYSYHLEVLHFIDLKLQNSDTKIRRFNKIF